MSQPGFGVMIHMLFGGTKHGSDEYVGKKIESAWLDEENNRFRIKFTDGKEIAIWDNGQSCCEHRYMRTDDDPKDLVGGKLRSIEVKQAPDEEDEYGEVHEVCFVEISTNKGHVVFANHNEHNGYYGGFALTITEADEDD